MKNLLFLILILTPLIICAQPKDTSGLTEQVQEIIDVAQKLRDERKFDEALAEIKTGEEFILNNLGQQTAEFAKYMLIKGNVYFDSGDYHKARKYYIECKNIRAEVLGTNSTFYASTVMSLANTYLMTAEFEIAEKLYKESMDTHFKASNGKNNEGYLNALSNLSATYSWQSKYEKAIPLMLECRDVQAKVIGRAHVNYAANIINLATTYMIVYDHEQIESLLLEAKKIFEEELNNTQHPFYAICLSSLGDYYQVMGNYKKAEEVLLKAVANSNEIYPAGHPGLALPLSNLARLHIGLGEYENAKPILLEAKEIIEGSSEESSKNYLRVLGDLANIHIAKEEYVRAEALLLKVEKIWQESYERTHHGHLNNLRMLGELYTETGQYKKAERYLLECKEKQEKINNQTDSYVMAIARLGKLYTMTNELERAEEMYAILAETIQHIANKAVRFQSEYELGKYLNVLSFHQNQILSFSRDYGSAEMGQICYDLSLFYKNFLLKATNRARLIALSDDVVAEQFNNIKVCERQLANEYSKPFQSRDSSNILALQGNLNTLEKALANTISGYAVATKNVKWEQVQSQLKKGEIAIEFVQYQYHNLTPSDSTLYAAIIIAPEKESPAFIPLFSEKEIIEFLKNNKNKSEYHVNVIYRDKALYELLWKPLEEHLLGVETIYYSPSGLLHRLNLNAILFESDAPLMEKYRTVQLNSTRQLVFPSKIENNKNNALLFGGINYEMDTTAVFSKNIDYNKTASRGSLSFSQSDSKHRGDSWDYLEWTEVEVSAIESILSSNEIQVELNKGYKASEEKFKAIPSPSPRILHIATHGFFFPDPKTKDGKRLTGDESVFKISDHPMIRSGLIMAGGNHAWKTGKPFKPNMEDGILTAYEISQMDLSNTELVVLSACETGLGDIDGNEGVYGLQRAFKIAGAKYLIMSLWQVPDYPTQQLMTAFYNNWLSKDMEIPDAFRAAQNEMKERFDDPFMWAGFVLVE